MDGVNSGDGYLKLAVFSVNTSVGPEEIFSILLVFGAIARPASTIAAPTQAAETAAVEKAGKDVE